MELSEISFLLVLRRSQELSHDDEKQVTTWAIASMQSVRLCSVTGRPQHALLLPDVLGLKIICAIFEAEPGAQQNLDNRLKRLK